MLYRTIPKLTAVSTLLRNTAWPISLSALRDFASSASYYATFRHHTENLFTPSLAETILSPPDIYDQVSSFITTFTETYFPIADHVMDIIDEGESPLYTLYNMFPFQLLGVDSTALHDPWDCFSPGICLMLLIINVEDACEDSDFPIVTNDIRVAWLEEASQHINTTITDLIPPHAFPLKVVAEALQGTRFQSLLNIPSWAFGRSENPFLVYSYEDELQSSFDDFDHLAVLNMTTEWHEANSIIDGIIELAKWIETDIEQNFSELIHHILTSPAYTGGQEPA